MPKLLDDVHKVKKMMMSLQHLQRYSKEDKRFLDLIITRDETWELQFTPESKQQSTVWEHSGSPVTISWEVDAHSLLESPGTTPADFMP